GTSCPRLATSLPRSWSRGRLARTWWRLQAWRTIRANAATRQRACARAATMPRAPSCNAIRRRRARCASAPATLATRRRARLELTLGTADAAEQAHKKKPRSAQTTPIDPVWLTTRLLVLGRYGGNLRCGTFHREVDGFHELAARKTITSSRAISFVLLVVPQAGYSRQP